MKILLLFFALSVNIDAYAQTVDTSYTETNTASSVQYSGNNLT